MKSALLIAAAIAAAGVSGSAVAQKGKPQPTPTPTPLVIVDATGKTAGRVVSSYDNYLTVTLTVGDAVVLARLKEFRVAGVQLTWQGGWATQPSLYYASANCSGVPLIAASNLGNGWWLPGFRPAVVYATTGAQEVLLVGANAAPTQQSVQSYGSVGCAITNNPSTCSSSCTAQSSLEYVFPLEATVNLTQTYPGPLTVK